MSATRRARVASPHSSWHETRSPRWRSGSRMPAPRRAVRRRDFGSRFGDALITHQGNGEHMSLITRTVLSRTLLAGFVLSFVGAKGCFGGEASLGSMDTAGTAGTAGTTSMAGSAGMTSSAGSTSSNPRGTGGSTALDLSCLLTPLALGCDSGSAMGYNY